jgi:hypothetical protein
MESSGPAKACNGIALPFYPSLSTEGFLTTNLLWLWRENISRKQGENFEYH